MVRFKALLTGVTLLVALACGGGNSSSTPTPVTPTPDQSPAGLWNGAMAVGTFYSTCYGVATPTGELRLATTGGGYEEILANLTVTSTNCTVTGTYFTRKDGGGSNTKVITAKGTLTTATSISITGTVPDPATSTTATLPVTIYLTYNTAYSTATASLAAVAGTTTVTANNGFPTTWTLSATGALTGSDTDGGTWSGQLTQPDPAANLFTVTATYTPATGPAVTYTGLGYGSGPTPTSLTGVDVILSDATATNHFIR